MYFKLVAILLLFSMSSTGTIIFRPNCSPELFTLYLKKDFKSGERPNLSAFQRLLPATYLSHNSENAIWIPSIIVDLFLLINRERFAFTGFNQDIFALTGFFDNQIPQLRVFNNIIFEALAGQQDWFETLTNFESQISASSPEHLILLRPGFALFREALAMELAAHKRQQLILWRYTRDFEADRAGEQLSFGLSLLAGYNRDGYAYASPMYGGQDSACPYIYWLTNQKKPGALYGLFLDQTTLSNSPIFLGNLPDFLQTLEGRGELFHPRVSLREHPLLPRIQVEDWYDDQQVNNALIARLEEEGLLNNLGVQMLAPVGGTTEGHQIQMQLQANFDQNHGLAINRIVLLPYNLGNNHWVALVIRIEAGQVFVTYLDTLVPNATLPDFIQNELHQVYPEFQITTLEGYQQCDGTSCGPFMVENMVQLAIQFAGQKPVFQTKDAAEIRRHHQALQGQILEHVSPAVSMTSASCF
ncbi:MAG: Ulp1 family isopeptidase [Myxococcaceae bacterium]